MLKIPNQGKFAVDSHRVCPTARAATVAVLLGLAPLLLTGCQDSTSSASGAGGSGRRTSSESVAALLSAPGTEEGFQRLKTAFERLRPSGKPLRSDDPNIQLFVEVLNRVVQDHVRAVEPAPLIEGAIKGLNKISQRKNSAQAAATKDGGDKAASSTAPAPGATTPAPPPDDADPLPPGPLTDRQLIEAAITGMMGELDPYSSYLNPENYRNMQAQTHGEFGGLGIEVTLDQKTGFIRVVAPFDGTPAAEAGLRSGDLISDVDGVPIKGMTLIQAVFRMRGPTGTSVRLTLRRSETAAPQVVTLTRRIVKLHPVQSKIEGEVGTVRITSFNERTANELEDAVTQIKRKLGNRLAGLVIDLRNDPGGLLDQAIAVSDDFIESGLIVSVRGRRSVEGRTYEATGDSLAPGLPIVVLINGGSASASEIVAAALQDHGRALVFGTRSYGKGSVQTVSPLPDGGALRLTTARYYRPNGTSVDCVGVAPDLEIKSPAPAGRTEEPHRDPNTCEGVIAPPPQPPRLRMAEICPGVTVNAPAPLPASPAAPTPDPAASGAGSEAKLPDAPMLCAVAALTGKRIISHR